MRKKRVRFRGRKGLEFNSRRDDGIRGWECETTALQPVKDSMGLTRKLLAVIVNKDCLRICAIMRCNKHVQRWSLTIG